MALPRHVLAQGGEDELCLRLLPHDVGRVGGIDEAARVGRHGDERELARWHVLQRAGQVVKTTDPAEAAVDGKRLRRRVKEAVDRNRVVQLASRPAGERRHESLLPRNAPEVATVSQAVPCPYIRE